MSQSSKSSKWAAFRTVMFSGAAIYLVLLSLTMFSVAAKGFMLWQADFLLQHGEPLLVLAFGVYCAYEAAMQIRRID